MKDLFEKFSSKMLFFVSLGVVGYFCWLYLNAYVVKSDFVLIGVFRELFTLPLIGFQFLLLILAIIYWIHDKFRLNTWSFWSFLILLASNSVMIGDIAIAIVHTINRLK